MNIQTNMQALLLQLALTSLEVRGFVVAATPLQGSEVHGFPFR